MASNFSDEQMKNEALQTFADKIRIKLDAANGE